jgi:hypothetical protein
MTIRDTITDEMDNTLTVKGISRNSKLIWNPKQISLVLGIFFPPEEGDRSYFQSYSFSQ